MSPERQLAIATGGGGGDYDDEEASLDPAVSVSPIYNPTMDERIPLLLVLTLWAGLVSSMPTTAATASSERE